MNCGCSRRGLRIHFNCVDVDDGSAIIVDATFRNIQKIVCGVVGHAPDPVGTIDVVVGKSECPDFVGSRLVVLLAAVFDLKEIIGIISPDLVDVRVRVCALGRV